MDVWEGGFTLIPELATVNTRPTGNGVPAATAGPNCGPPSPHFPRNVDRGES